MSIVAGLIGSAGIGAASGLGSSVLQWGANRNLQEHQYELNREYRQTNYQDVVADMKKAGINPGALQGSGILGTGGYAASGSSVSAPQIMDPSLINNMLRNSVLASKQSKDDFLKQYQNAAREVKQYENLMKEAYTSARFGDNGGFDEL